MIFSTFFIKILHSPYFIGYSRTCFTTYFRLKAYFWGANMLFKSNFDSSNKLFSREIEQIPCFFADINKFLTIKSTLMGYLWDTCLVKSHFAPNNKFINKRFKHYKLFPTLQFSIFHIIFQFHQLIIIIIFISLIYSIKFSAIIKIFINCINYTFHLFS